MGKTYKKHPWKHIRFPKGKKRAVINGARHRAVPPDSYDDIIHDKSGYDAGNVGFALHKKGWDDDKIVRHIRKKFGYTDEMARRSIFYNDRLEGNEWYGCDCKECKRLYDIRMKNRKLY